MFRREDCFHCTIKPVHVEALGTTDIYAPGVGQIIPLSEVPDQVFAGKMMGDGCLLFQVLLRELVHLTFLQSLSFHLVS
jgi:hypothetical protein